MPVKRLTPHRHLQLIERIFHHIIRIQLIDPPHNHIHIRLLRLGEQQELRPGHRLEARQAEERRLEHFDAGERGARDRRRGGGDEGGRCERARDGVHAVEGPREDEVVVDGELVQPVVEVALVDETASFVDDDEGVDDPGGGRSEEGHAGWVWARTCLLRARRSGRGNAERLASLFLGLYRAWIHLC